MRPRSLARAARPLLLLLAVSALGALAGCRHAGPAAGARGERIAANLTRQPAPAPAHRLWMVAVGDVMLDRNVGKRIKANGATSILARVRDQLRAPALTFANLECPLSSTGPHDPPNCCFRADPATVSVLRDGGIDVVALANNHSLNAGRQGILNTLDVLDRNNIAYAGAARDRAQVWQPALFEVKGLRVGFLACTDLSFDHGSYTKVGPDRAAAVAAVKAARKQTDLLFVSVHWGEEYQSLPSKRQQATARALIDAGADCILGHHPHTLQGVGVYRGRPILYSMGNFVFDQRQGERMTSAIFDLWWKQGGGWQIKAAPIWIPPDRLGPIYPDKARSLSIAKRLQQISEAVGTRPTLQGSRVLWSIPAGGVQPLAQG
jgi:hypothetical protein